jgi:RNA polymerase sigma-70 factor (ECF subfamily)
MAPSTDLELVESFRQGHVEGFNELVRRYQQRVYWIARRIVGSHEDADDVAQEVFVRVYNSLHTFRSDSGFYTWVYRITVNVALNSLRARKAKMLFRLDDLVEQPHDDNARPDEHVERGEYQTMLERAIDRLPAKQKLVFTMRYVEEMPYEEISRVLGKSVGGLKANYFHALKKVQSYIKREMES